MNQKHMGWISLQMQWGLNTAQGEMDCSEVVWGRETQLNQTGLFFFSVNFCHHCPEAHYFYPLNHATPRNGKPGSSLPMFWWGPKASPVSVRLRGSWMLLASFRLLSRMSGRSRRKSFLWKRCFSAHSRLLRWSGSGWRAEPGECRALLSVSYLDLKGVDTRLRM